VVGEVKEGDKDWIGGPFSEERGKLVVISQRRGKCRGRGVEMRGVAIALQQAI